MIAAAEETKPWSRRRWSLTIAFVLAFQALLVFLLENRSPAVPRKLAPAQMIRMRDNVSLSLLPVNDPTLFALPHREGFSGAAWLNKIATNDFHPADWTETPRWLKLTAETLGASFKQFIAANASPAFQNIITTPAPLLTPTLFPQEIPAPGSTLQIGGGLAGRSLLSPPQLQSWTNFDALTNSIVQVLVNASGDTLSTTLRQSCGLTAADAKALDIARQARFSADTSNGADHPANGFTLGILTFEWQTLPPPQTNAPPGSL